MNYPQVRQGLKAMKRIIINKDSLWRRGIEGREEAEMKLLLEIGQNRLVLKLLIGGNLEGRLMGILLLYIFQ